MEIAQLKEKKYRNLFLEAGHTQEEIDRRLEEIWNTFFYGSDEERVYFPVGDDMAYVCDTGNIDARTEGMSYGMMFCVQMDRKVEFDRLWKWARTYMWMDSGDNEGYFAWSCALDGTKNAYGPAPDGEEFLPWRCSLHHTDGATARVFMSIHSTQRKFCGLACIRDKMAERDAPCGILKTIRFYLCRE